VEEDQNNPQGAPQQEDVLLTTAEVAALLRRPIGTIRYWRHIGYGPRGFYVGRCVMYWRSEVLAWLYEQSAA
jgi:hypothetical protein